MTWSSWTSIDHARGQSWIISQGLPKAGKAREQQAYRRMQQFLAQLECEAPAKDPRPLTAVGTRPLPANRLAPQFPTRWSNHWTSNFSSEDYRQAVARAVEYVHAGDIFQVNLAQRLLHRARCSAADLALHLRHTNPAPFAGYADFGRVQIVSTSPERFLTLQQGQIEARPIKGTRPRMSDRSLVPGESIRTSGLEVRWAVGPWRSDRRPNCRCEHC